MQRRKFLLSILVALPVIGFSALTNSVLTNSVLTNKTIKLIKDQNVVLDFIGGVYSVNIYGRDKDDVFWHWKLLYRLKSENINIQICDPLEVIQIFPPLNKNQEISKLNYNYSFEYKAEYLSGLLRKLTIEELQIKPAVVTVDISCKTKEKHEAFIEK